jgi:predicted PurR-regulated permease PerM
MAANPRSVNAGNGTTPHEEAALRTVSVRTVALGTLVVGAVALAFIFITRFYIVLFLFLVAVILATVTRPAVEWLARRGIRQELGVILVYLALLLAITLFGLIVAPLFVGQITGATNQLPQLYSQFRESLLAADTRLVQRFAAGLPESLTLPQVTPRPPESTLASFTPAGRLVSQVASGGFIVIAILALAYYWVLEGELVVRRALFFMGAERREQVRSVWAEMEGKVAAFFRGQLILMIVVAVLTLIGYGAVGMPYALALALIAGVCEAIPIIGPTIAVIPAILVALSVAPDKLLFAIGVGVAVQLLENNLLVPKIMDQSVGVNPVVTILAIAAFGALFGFAGALLAIPLAAMVQIVVRRLLFERAATMTTNVGRSRASILRLATQELAEDIRKASRGYRENEAVVDPNAERAEDLIESIAVRLDELLSVSEEETS